MSIIEILYFKIASLVARGLFSTLNLFYFNYLKLVCLEVQVFIIIVNGYKKKLIRASFSFTFAESSDFEKM